jgi:hypothetical protein
MWDGGTRWGKGRVVWCGVRGRLRKEYRDGNEIGIDRRGQKRHKKRA